MKRTVKKLGQFIHRHFGPGRATFRIAWQSNLTRVLDITEPNGAQQHVFYGTDDWGHLPMTVFSQCPAQLVAGPRKGVGPGERLFIVRGGLDAGLLKIQQQLDERGRLEDITSDELPKPDEAGPFGDEPRVIGAIRVDGHAVDLFSHREADVYWTIAARVREGNVAMWRMRGEPSATRIVATVQREEPLQTFPVDARQAPSHLRLTAARQAIAILIANTAPVDWSDSTD